jgi:hypothetical protein
VKLIDNQFVSAKGPTGVFAKKARGRWQYRTESGNLLASGMEPAAFVKSFWMRDDFEGGL